jgi:molybdate transport system substrate-binding protein
MATTRFMCALVIIDAVKQEVLPPLGDDAPEIVWDPTAALMKRIGAGERADGIFAIDASLDELEARGVIDGATRRPIAEAEFGIAVKPGMGISAPADGEALKALLLNVPSIAYSRSGASGIYFEKLIERLGIVSQVRAKSVVIPAGLTAEKVRDGEAVLAVQQMSELRAVEGIHIIGPFPADVQQTTNFSAAVFTDADNPSGARAFIEALSTPAARAAYLARGLKVRF